MYLFTQIQEDEKDKQILLLSEKIARLEKELVQSKTLATSYHKEKLLLVEECSDLKKNLTTKFVQIQDLEHSLYKLHECASKQAYAKENKATQIDLVSNLYLGLTCIWV